MTKRRNIRKRDECSLTFDIGIPEDLASFIAATVGKNPELQDRETVAISFDRPKCAALWYERLWSTYHDVPDTIRFFRGTVPEMIAYLQAMLNYAASGGKLKGGRMFGADDKPIEQKTLIETWKDLLKRYPDLRRVYDPDTPRAARTDLRQMSTIIAGAVGVPIIPVYSSLRSRDLAYGEGDWEAIVSILSNLEIVDEDSISWEQVLEFRRDEKAQRLYKRFLHWLDSKMIGRSLSYIEDEITLRYEDYLWSLKKHGINTVLGTLSTTLDSKTIFSGAIAVVSAAIAGEPLWGLFASSGIVVGKIAVKAARVLLDLQDIRMGSYAEIALVHELSRIKKR